MYLERKIHTKPNLYTKLVHGFKTKFQPRYLRFPLTVYYRQADGERTFRIIE